MHDSTGGSDAPSAFLDAIEPASYKGAVGTLFYTAIRQGVTDPGAICRRVRKDALYRLMDFMLRQLPREFEESIHAYVVLIDRLADDPEGARRFARNCLEREAMPPLERAQQKQERQVVYQQESMKGKEPTAKQLAILRKHGITDVADRFDASQKITEIFSQN